MQRALFALLIMGLGSWLGLNLRPLLDGLADRLRIDPETVVGIVLFWCLLFIGSYVVFRLRRTGP